MQIRSGVKCALAMSVAATLVMAASEVSANGRFPRGEQIVEFPSNTNHILLSATYGMVTTNDGGKNWYYVCETAFSHYPPPSATDPGYNGDPLVGLTTGEAILANVQARITKSTDVACNWTKSFEEPGSQVEDIAVAPSNRDIAVALVRSGTATKLIRTMDGGATWSTVGMPLTNVVVAYTIDVDAKDPMHLMVTGITSYDTTADTGVFLNSTNGGVTWASSPIPKTNLNAPPYIAAVHPNDAKMVFVRTDEWVDNDIGAYDARDALFYTKDGGQTWTELLRPIGQEGPGAKLFGFAISPDGATVLAGFGDPVDGSGRTVDRALTGVYKSVGPDFSFGPTPMPSFVESLTCITWTAKGIYLCGSPDGAASYIAFASDVSKLTPTGITKIMDVNHLSGEPPCCAGRAVTTCDWAVDCIRFMSCGDGSTPPPPGADAAVCQMPSDGGREGGAIVDVRLDETGGAGGGGTGGASGGAGGAGMGGAATGGSSGSGTGGSAGSDDGCNCRTAATSHGRTSAALGLLLGLAGASGWRRSRRRNAST